MSWFENNIYLGNKKQMLKMHQEDGFGFNTISSAFKDKGIDVEPYQVKSIIESNGAMCSGSFTHKDRKALKESMEAVETLNQKGESEEFPA